MCLAVGTEHPLAQCNLVGKDLLRNQCFLTCSDGSFGYKQYRELLIKEFGISPARIKDMFDIDTLILNVEAGLGVALLSNTPQLVENRGIRLLPINNHLNLSIIAAWRKDVEGSAKKKFLKLFRDATKHSKDSGTNAREHDLCQV
jgi:DNA-binding transcriptional LysR family regulator